MQPSSLIFLVIIGIWAAYFVQYWVRRREHLDTIRSVDAFSETMRVLQRRAPLPSVDHGGQAPRTYAVSPARATRPQVTVKRAEVHVAAPVEPAAFAEPATPAVHVMRPGRAARGIVVLVGLAGTVIFAALSLLGVLVSWAFVVPLAMAAGGFLWLRAGVQAELKARRAARGRARRAAARDSLPETARPSAPLAASASSSSSAASTPARRAPRTQTPVAETAPGSAPFDVALETVASAPAVQAPVEAAPALETSPAAHHVGAPPELDEDDIPLTWDPRPVPRPTYTMKAKAAERPAPAADVEPAAPAEHPAYDEVLQRRTAGA